MPSRQFLIAVDNDDGGCAYNAGTAWPPNATGSFAENSNDASSGGMIYAYKSAIAGPAYYAGIMLFRWDTSPLPDDAVITAASLTLDGGQYRGSDLMKLVGDYYDFGGEPAVAADWILTASPSIFTAQTPVGDATNVIVLTDLTGINLSGYTGIRLTFENLTPSAGADNAFNVYCRENATADWPRLDISYTSVSEESARDIGPSFFPSRRGPGPLRFAPWYQRTAYDGAQIFPTTALLDDANRANGAIGANWTTAYTGSGLVISSLEIASGQADGTDAGGFFNSVTAQDVELWMVVDTPASGSEAMSLNWRTRDTAGVGDPSASSAWSGYQLTLWDPTAATKLQIGRWDGSTYTLIWSTTTEGAISGDQIVVQHVDTGLQLWRERNGEWLQLASLQESFYVRAGRIGMEINDSGARVRQYGGGGFPLPPPITGTLYAKTGTVVAGTVASGVGSLPKLATLQDHFPASIDSKWFTPAVIPTNLHTNGGFESAGSGWGWGAAWTPSSVSSPVKKGSAALQTTYTTPGSGDSLPLFQGVSFPGAGSYLARAWVWIPTSFRASSVAWAVDDMTTYTAADMNIRDRWQLVQIPFSLAGAGTHYPQANADAATVAPGDYLVFDDAQVGVEVGTAYWDSGSQQAALPAVPLPNVSTLGTKGVYDLTASSFSAKASPAAQPPDAGLDLIVFDGDNALQIGVWRAAAGEEIYAYHYIGGVGTKVSAGTITYDPVAHAWWRIREAAGTIYYETSPDGVTWNVLASETSPFNVERVAVRFEAYTSSGTTGNTAYVDQVNIRISLKTGTVTAGTRLDGADSVTRTEVGLATAGTKLEAVKAVSKDRVGAAVATTRLIGTDSFTASELGTVTAGTIAASPRTVAFNRTNTVATRALPAAVDVFTSSELGNAVAGTLALGADAFTASELGLVTTRALPIGADVFTATETGAVTSAALASGADSFNPVESGAVTAGTVATGTHTDTVNRTGTATAGTLLLGVDAFTASELGTATTATRLVGADVFTASETGAVTTAALASGADVFTAVEMGVVSATTLAYGTAVLVSVGGTTYTKLGVVAAVTVAFGSDAWTAAETGTITTAALAAGTDSFTAAETGTVAARGQAGGTDAFTSSELGTAVAGTLSSGFDSVTRAETGAVLTQAQVLGSDVFTATEGGLVTSAALLAGADTFTSSETGTVVAGTKAQGADVFTAVEAGVTWAGTLAAGADSFQATESGTAVAGTNASGVSQSSTPLKIKTGTVVAGTLAIGADATTFARSGRVISGTIFVSSKLTEKTKAGTVTTTTRVSGLDALTASETGIVTARALISGADATIFSRAGTVVATPISRGDLVWVTSARPVTGEFDTPTPDNQIGSTPYMTVFQSSPTSKVTSDPHTGVFESDPELAP